MKWCSVTSAAVMFSDCVVVWATAVNFGQFVDDAAAVVVWAAAAAVMADELVLAVAILAALTVWNDVVELPAPAAAASAAVGLTSLASVAVAACFAVEPVRGSAVELVHAAE